MAEYRLLQSFIAVAATGSISGAANRLGYSQPAITHQIHQLERRLGVMLFDRSTHPVRLTAEGRERLLCAEAIVLMMERLYGPAELGLMRFDRDLDPGLARRPRAG